MLHSTKHYIVLLVTLGALAVPTSALATGDVYTTASGDITYEGDSNPNVLTVTTSLTSPTAAKIVFSEAGITEGSDTGNLCTPSANTVTCNFVPGGDKLTLNGDDGTDRLTLDGPLSAYIYGENGADELRGGDALDSMNGGAGSDTVDGRGGNDVVSGDEGTDVTLGGDGNDYSYTDLGNNDQIDLGPGRDYFFTYNGDGTGDVLRGGDGVDALSFYTEGGSGEQPFTTVDLVQGTLSFGTFGNHGAGTDAVSGIEDVGEYLGQSGNDVLIGNGQPNVLAGGRGNDRIVGGAGTDTIMGDGLMYGPDNLVDLPLPGDDTIDAADGFEDRIQCGTGTDSLVSDQFDGNLMSACENVDVRQMDPFGIPPAQMPEAPASGGGAQAEPDVRAPACTYSKLGPAKRAKFMRSGLSFTLTCDEQARVEARASVAVRRADGRRLVLQRVGDLVLGEQTLDVASNQRRVAIKVPRSLRRALGRRFTVNVRIDATDARGNRSTKVARLKVR